MKKTIQHGKVQVPAAEAGEDMGGDIGASQQRLLDLTTAPPNATRVQVKRRIRAKSAATALDLWLRVVWCEGGGLGKPSLRASQTENAG